MPRNVIFLINRDHLHHVMTIEHDGASDVQPTSEGGYVVPEDATFFKVFCQECDCRLMEHEDFLVRELEPWQDAFVLPHEDDE